MPSFDLHGTVLLYRVISVICQTLFYGWSYTTSPIPYNAPTTDLPLYHTSTRHILVSRSHLDSHNAVRDLSSKLPDIFSNELVEQHQGTRNSITEMALRHDHNHVHIV